VHHLDEVVVQARQQLYDCSGIYISGNQLSYFERQILARMEELELESGFDYLERLSNGTQDDEISQLLKRVFVSDTRFFSHRFQINAIVEYAIPEILHERNLDRINIWYHGMARGEGLYSLLLLLNEQVRRITRKCQYRIIGSDVDSLALERTRQAKFRWSSLSHLDEELRKTYFEVVDNTKYRFLPLPDQELEFLQLVPHEDEQWQAVETVDLIIFQNILMYYGLRQRQQIAEKLYNKLNPLGYLFVGPTESLYQVTDSFNIIHFTKTLGYKKPGDGSQK